MNMDILKKIYKCENGATVVEYGLLAACISIGIIVGVGAVGGGIGDLLNGISNAF